jgi:diguanylate cyclase (GGDEF)-like protein
MANTIGLDALAFFILIIVFANMSKRAERSFTQQRLFMAMIFTLAVMLSSDAIGWIADGQPGIAAQDANWASMLLLFILTPGIPALYILYAHYTAYHGDRRLRPLVPPLAVLVTLDAVFNLSSLYTGWTFTVDAANRYHRGPLFFIHLCFCYALFVYAVVFIIVNRKRIDERHFGPLLAFGLLPAAASAVQGLIPSLTVMAPSMALSALLLYINIQDHRLDTDYLTGVYNRRLLDAYMKERTQPGSARKAFSAILIDLDNFKSINDTLGHALGDDALTDTVRLLQGCLRRGDFVSRYGGDEFLIILDIGSREVLEETVGRIRECFRQFNEAHERPYRLSFSTGYDVYDMAGGMDPEQFIKRVDEKMYEEKKAAGHQACEGKTHESH